MVKRYEIEEDIQIERVSILNLAVDSFSGKELVWLKDAEIKLVGVLLEIGAMKVIDGKVFGATEIVIKKCLFCKSNLIWCAICEMWSGGCCTYSQACKHS